MRKTFLGTALAAIAMTIIGTSSASALSFSVEPWEYNPDNVTGIKAEWQTVTPDDKPANMDACKNGGFENLTDNDGMTFKNQGQCIAFFNKGEVETNEVLILEKEQNTSVNAASGATLTGLGDFTLNQLGFDYSGYCGAGAPRFNVYTDTDTYFFFGCNYGIASTLENGFTRVNFENSDAVAADGTTVWPGFGSVDPTKIEIVLDEGPSTSVMIDNISVNGIVIGQ